MNLKCDLDALQHNGHLMTIDDIETLVQRAGSSGRMYDWQGNMFVGNDILTLRSASLNHSEGVMEPHEFKRAPLLPIGGQHRQSHE